MAKQPVKATATQTTPPFRGYVRKDLSTEEDVASFRLYEGKETDKSILVNLLGAVDNGYKVSLKIDGKGYKVEMFNLSGPEAARGFILSAYGSSARKAMTALWYKHYELLGEDWDEHLNVEAPEVR